VRGDGAGVTPATLLEREGKPLEKKGEMMELTVGAHMSASGREGVGYRFGAGVVGPWACSGRGLEWFPGSSFIFFSPLFFSFSIFLFLS
jgi:hypothetical protein